MDRMATLIRLKPGPPDDRPYLRIGAVADLLGWSVAYIGHLERTAPSRRLRGIQRGSACGPRPPSAS
jgi:hypothetical protein